MSYKSRRTLIEKVDNCKYVYEYTSVPSRNSKTIIYMIAGIFSDVMFNLRKDGLLFNPINNGCNRITEVISNHYIFSNGSEYVFDVDENIDSFRHIIPKSKYKNTSLPKKKCRSLNFYFNECLRIKVKGVYIRIFVPDKKASFIISSMKNLNLSDMNEALDYIHLYLRTITKTKENLLNMKRDVVPILKNYIISDLINIIIDYLDLLL